MIERLFSEMQSITGIYKLSLLTLFFGFMTESSPADSSALEKAPDSHEGLVVHEWGVKWVGHHQSGPLFGPKSSYLESLPAFVIRNEEVSPTTMVPQPFVIKKPVIHFYGREGQEIKVRIQAPDGAPVVYYPTPKITRSVSALDLKVLRSVPKVARTTEISWSVKLHKALPGKLAEAPEDHWWNDIREIPGDYVSLADGSASERFLFYEGTTKRRPVISASVHEKMIVVTNTHTEQSSPIVILINDNGHFRGTLTPRIAAGKFLTLEGGDFEQWDDATILEKCRQHWIACGMTEEEAKGIVNSWQPELLGTKGFLVISRIPRHIYDQIYPITITPTPSELERTCMVFDTLTGQDNRRHWLPNQAKRGLEIFKNLGDADFNTRMRARADLVAEGEIMLPFINDVLAKEDGELDLESKMLLRQIQEISSKSTVSPPEVKPATGQIVPVPFGGGIPLEPMIRG